ncbi:MAG: hypothetical protein IPK85_03175 [Gemmatimonadetes bacterium]|nr:hypothetical protein [Gemmatimonadota bacterium]
MSLLLDVGVGALYAPPVRVRELPERQAPAVPRAVLPDDAGGRLAWPAILVHGLGEDDDARDAAQVVVMTEALPGRKGVDVAG